ncbi:MAG: tol-pal system protein YbgF [Sulfuriflexus sp.]|nr:tol-pal system protein YbgF [Sulfuriflexus sp.]
MIKLKLHHVALFSLAGIMASPSLIADEEANEKRITRLEKLVEGQGLVDMYLRLETLQQEVQQLRGEVEVQTNSIEGLKQRQRDLYLDIDRRLRQLESGVVEKPQASTTVTPTAPVAPTAGTAPTTNPSDPVVEETAYRAAFKLLKEGRYAPATSRFRAFLVKHPSSAYADNAQYWLGEVSYVTRAYEQAIAEFDKVLNNYPDSTKHADALLKQGYCYYELNNFVKANELLAAVITRYPHSTAARLADKRRKQISAEGH